MSSFSSTSTLSTLLAIALFAVPAFAILAIVGSKGSARNRRDRPRHWLLRTLFALIGAGMLLTVWVSTVRAAQRPYAVSEDRAGTPTLMKTREFSPEEGQKQIRTLVHSALVDSAPAGFRLVHLKQQVLEKTGELAVFEDQVKVQGSKYRTQIEIRGRRTRHSMSAEHPSGRHSQSGSIKGGKPEVMDLGNDPMEISLVSLSRNAPYSPRLILWIEHIHPEDPLRKVSPSDWLEALESTRPSTSEASWVRRMPSAEGYLPIGIRYLTFAPAVTLVILGAGGFLSNLFRNRNLGALLMLFGCLLFHVGLDRSILSTHLERLASGNDAQKRMAVVHATDSFFFRKTAEQEIRKAAEKPDSSPALKQLAMQISQVLEKENARLLR